MKIAYLMLAHKDHEQIKRLASLLAKTGDCYIHLDKKSDRSVFESTLAPVEGLTLLSKYSVSWAGWSMVQAYLYLMDHAYASDKQYDRFVFMTGQDYPLMPDEQILQEFSENPDVEYVMAYNIATSTIPTDKNKILKNWYLDTPFRSRFLQRAYKSLMYRCITKPFSGKQLKVKLGGEYVDPYFGQMLSSFTRKGADLLLQTYKYDKVFNKKMKRVYAAVEIYWQTVIFNSPLRKNTVQGGEEHEITEHFGWAPHHYHNYDVDTSVYTEKDFEELKNSGYMFFRKVVPGISDALMDKIDELRKG